MTPRGSIFDAMTPAMIARELMRRAVRGELDPSGGPEPGYWVIRLVKGGPPAPACIRWVETLHEPGLPENVMERSRFLAAFILEEPADLDAVWRARQREEITEGDYRFRVDDQRWAKGFKPREAIARPRQRVDWYDTPPAF